MTTAKIIADSISEAGARITTLELEYNRFLHGQLMTHRMFSRNAQSSRAIPTAKQIELIKNVPAPHFLKNKAGMQASEEFQEWEHHYAVQYWNQARDYAIQQAEAMLDLGVHKQWANRLLEPFSTIKVVVTATEWDNFFELRLHHDAQPEMQQLAQAMKTAMDNSTPVLLRAGEWHLPYITDDDRHYYGTDGGLFEEWQKELPKISSARCARVSYLNHDKSEPDVKKDLQLFHDLVIAKPVHGSPTEHQATPIDYLEFEKTGFDFDEVDGITHIDKKARVWSNNFCGWISHRALL